MNATDMQHLFESDEEQQKRLTYFENLKKIQEAKNAFLKSGKIPPCVRTEVADSWRRSYRYLDPEDINTTRIEGAALDRLLTQNKLLIRLSSSVVEPICSNLHDNEYYVVYVTDRNGYIIWVNQDYEESTSAVKGINIGVRSLEEYIGTSPIGLALIHKRDMMTHGPEHFLKKNEKFTCTTSLIHDNDESVIGAVTISFNFMKFNSMIANISSIAAKLIEEQFTKYRFSEQLESIAYHSSESILIVDSHIEPIYANKKFTSLLNIDEDEISNLDVNKIFGDFDFNAIISEEAGYSSECTLSWNDHQYRMNIYARPIFKDELLDCIVLFCQEISSLINMSRKFTGEHNYCTFDDIITRDSAMQNLIAQCKRIANLDVPVLIHGLSGVGKELFAQSIHSASNRADKPFMTVNCAALPLDLIESELFGYEKGAFTGADRNGRMGKFELANGGTIFLDEIGELPLGVQAKLLRVLDNYKVSRIGSSKETVLDVRVLSATNRNLQEEVAAKNFREDLFYRLNVLNVLIPPLNDREGDVELLAEHFLRELNAKAPSQKGKSFTRQTLEALAGHKWQGNVRELYNAVIRAYYLSESTLIQPYFLPVAETKPAHVSTEPAGRTKNDKEKALIESALSQSNGSVPKASKICGIPVSSLYRKINKYNIYTRQFKTH